MLPSRAPWFADPSGLDRAAEVAAIAPALHLMPPGADPAAIDFVLDPWLIETDFLEPPPVDPGELPFLAAEPSDAPIDLLIDAPPSFAGQLEHTSRRDLYRLPISPRTRAFEIGIWMGSELPSGWSGLDLEVLDSAGQVLAEMPVRPGRAARISLLALRPPPGSALFLAVSARSAPTSGEVEYALNVARSERPIGPAENPGSTGVWIHPGSGADSRGGPRDPGRGPIANAPRGLASLGSGAPGGASAGRSGTATLGQSDVRAVPVQAATPFAGRLDLGLDPTHDASESPAGPDGEPMVERLLSGSQLQSEEDSSAPALLAATGDQLVGTEDVAGEWDRAIEAIRGAAGMTLLSATIWMEEVGADPPLGLLLATPTAPLSPKDLTLESGRLPVEVEAVPADQPPDRDRERLWPSTARTGLLLASALLASLWLPELRGQAPCLRPTRFRWLAPLGRLRNAVGVHRSGVARPSSPQQPRRALV